MNKKKWYWLAGAVLIGAAVLFLATHAFVDGKFYAKGAELLDLRGKDISAEHYELVRAEFPGKEILWDVPFQGGTVPHDSKALAVTTLTEADLAMLDYLQELELVDAEKCTDYPQLEALRLRRPELEVQYCVTVDGKTYAQDAAVLELSEFTREELDMLRYLPELKSIQADNCREYDLLMALQEQYPQIHVSYQVELDGNRYPGDTSALELEGVSAEELMEVLPYFPQLTQVSVTEPEEETVMMHQLTEAYPQVSFYWEKEILDQTVTSEDTQFSYIPEDLETVTLLEQELASFPNLERVYLGYCQLDNDALAQYRDRVRPEYKVVWNILIGAEYIDTDATWFMPGKTGRGLMEHQAVLLKYCEDMVCIDVGHKRLLTCDFVKYMPNLKYLILGDTCIQDITPLETCKNLIYLEIMMTFVKDYSPLLGCTALQDLNISLTYGDPEPLYQMHWLKRLHWCNHENLRAELEEALPDTELMIAMDFSTAAATGQGWRQHQNYYDMRDILGMYYML